nr:type I restriction-modification enzyme R subunit C-terminal domain-containing protein [Chamaesiphon sp. GL140_3_metabinner_50]
MKISTELFADRDFDGDPVQIYEPKHPDDSPVPPELPEGEDDVIDGVYPPEGGFEWTDGDEPEDVEEVGVRRYVVANVEVRVIAERVQYYDSSGKLIAESLKDYTRKKLNQEFTSLDNFLVRWSSADKKQAIVDELAKEGIFFEALADEIGKDCDPFDLLCHIAWDMPPLTRKERAEQVKKRDYFIKYGELARRVLEALLDKYADAGVGQIEETQVLTVAPFTQFGTPLEIVRGFGGTAQYQEAIRDLKRSLYSA